MLRQLAKHGIHSVFLEGLTDKKLPAFRKHIATLRGFAKGKQKGETPIEQFMLAEFRNDLLQIGSPGRLMVSGTLRVRAAEDTKAYEAANPIGKDGRVRINLKANERRESAIVKRLLAGGPVAVVVLGGAHDLSDNLPASCEYIRVVTKAYAECIEP